MFEFFLLVVAALALSPQAVKGQLLGADDALPDEFPYHVFLKNGEQLHCSGTLISLEHVLTAGHCVEVLIRRVHVQTYGIQKLTAVVGTNIMREGGQTIDIIGAALKDGYVAQEPPTCLNDIGLYLLKEKVKISTHVRPVNLPKIGKIQIDSEAIVVAAGSTCSSGGPPLEILQKLSVTIISRDQCQDMMVGITIYDSFICTLVSKGKGQSIGDSGGPLVQNNVIIGVAVGSTNPSGRGFPDIYIDVYYYLRWIKETTSI